MASARVGRGIGWVRVGWKRRGWWDGETAAGVREYNRAADGEAIDAVTYILWLIRYLGGAVSRLVYGVSLTWSRSRDPDFPVFDRDQCLRPGSRWGDGGSLLTYTYLRMRGLEGQRWILVVG